MFSFDHFEMINIYLLLCGRIKTNVTYTFLYKVIAWSIALLIICVNTGNYICPFQIMAHMLLIHLFEKLISIYILASYYKKKEW